RRLHRDGIGNDGARYLDPHLKAAHSHVGRVGILRRGAVRRTESPVYLEDRADEAEVVRIAAGDGLRLREASLEQGRPRQIFGDELDGDAADTVAVRVAGE